MNVAQRLSNLVQRIKPRDRVQPDEDGKRLKSKLGEERKVEKLVEEECTQLC